MPPWFRTLMDRSPEVYFRYALAPVRRMTYVSPAVQELTGYARDTFYADPRLCRSVVAPADRYRLGQLTRARRGGNATLELQRQDGGTVPVHVRTVPVVRARKIIAIEGVVTLAFASPQSVDATRTTMPEPVQQRLAALLSEVHGLLHRHGVSGAEAGAAASTSPVLWIADIALDADRMTTTLAGKRVALTTRELLLLKYLAQRRGRVVTRRQLLEDVWGYQFAGDDRTVDVHVSRLRRKLPSLRGLLVAVKHVGYRLEPAAESAAPVATPRRVANS